MEFPAGIINGDNWDRLVAYAKGALTHMLSSGEVPAEVGEPITPEQALSDLEGFLDRNKVTLFEGGYDFLASLARRLVVRDEPDEPLSEFEAKLTSLTDEQLTAMAEAEADNVEALKADVIDRRRQLLADVLETGQILLRGAFSSGLHALLGLA